MSSSSSEVAVRPGPSLEWVALKERTLNEMQAISSWVASYLLIHRKMPTGPDQAKLIRDAMSELYLDVQP